MKSVENTGRGREELLFCQVLDGANGDALPKETDAKRLDV